MIGAAAPTIYDWLAMKTSALFLLVALPIVCAFGGLACERDPSSAPAASPASASPSAPVSTAAAPSVASTATAPAPSVAQAPSAPTSSAPTPGSDRDAHSCIGSAGYRWCAKENACVRSWELATAKGFPNDPSAFAAYCR